jgi:putative glutamine amidotransferase
MHKENPDDPLEVQYSPSHKVSFAAGGMLQRVTGSQGAMVNSLHAQGVNRLGSGLEVEAVAEDGLVEGFAVRDAPGFTLAVQWHPEWQVLKDPVSTAIFGAYGDACRSYRLRGLAR